MASIVGLLILAVVSAAVFGYLVRLLMRPDELREVPSKADNLTETGILRWVARQCVADLANRRGQKVRVTVADVIVKPNPNASGAFICTVDCAEWDSIVFKVQVERSTMSRFSASVYCSENGQTLFYNRAYELEVAGLEEKIEMS